jgi:hypothetical protein
MGSLTVHRKVSTVSMTPVRAHFNMASEIGRNVAPKIAFNFVILVYQLTNLNDIIIGKIVAF